MVGEIKRNYIYTDKKIVLDYILRDDNEKLRIGVHKIFNGTKDYGEEVFEGIFAERGWV